MKKRTIIRLAAYILAAFAVMGGFIYVNYQTAEEYRLYIKNDYQYAFSELVSSINDIDTALQKSLYATSPSMVSAVCTEVYAKSTAAQMAMSQLPFSSNDLEHTASFISMVGDYAFMLSKSAAAGNRYTDEQFQNLNALSQSASLLSQNMTQLYADIENGIVTISDVQNAQTNLAKTEDSTVPTNLTDSVKLMETEFPETPSLIYDGPFSEHITNMSPKMIENMPTVSQDQALQAAADFCAVDKNSLTFLYERNSNPAVYVFGSDTGRDNVLIEVTKQGGVILNLTNSRDVDSSSLSKEDAVGIAQNFLTSHGYNSMATSYVMQQQNVAIINFAYTQNDIICYTDLVKVSVALDQGQVVGFEALGYVMSHYERNIPELAVSQEEAQQNVSKNLTVLSHQMTVIPTDGKYEVFCHEFKCENESGQHLIVYVNAVTGNQERILILIEDANGTLTI